LATIIGISVVTLLLAGPIFLQTENIFKNIAYGQGYNIIEIKDSKEDTEEEEEAMEEADVDD
jgi:hypothetical protein